MALWNHDSSHEITLPSAAKQIIVAKKASNGDKDLYFISLNEPYGDFEGFVVFSNDTCSYYDLTNHTLVRDGQIVTTDARCLDNDLEEVEVEYNFDYQRQGEPDPAGIVAYLNVLQSY
jgi:hypothetical protein